MLFLFDKIKHTQYYVQKYKKIIDYRQINNTCQHTNHNTAQVKI